MGIQIRNTIGYYITIQNGSNGKNTGFIYVLAQNAKTTLLIVLKFILTLSGTNYLIIVQGFSIKLQDGLVRILEAYLQEIQVKISQELYYSDIS
jgi:hypothetical protein